MVVQCMTVEKQYWAGYGGGSTRSSFVWVRQGTCEFDFIFCLGVCNV